MNDEHYVSWENRTYKNQFVSLDNGRFASCRFEGVTFLYAGGPWRIEACQFDPGCKLVLQGAALLTGNLLEECRRRLGLLPVSMPDPGSSVQ